MAKKFNFSEERDKAIIAAEKKLGQGLEQIAEQPAVAEPAPEPQPIAQTIPAAVSIGNGEPTQNINVPIPVSLHQQLKIYAAQTKQNMKDLVVVAIKEFMDHQPK